MNLHKKLIAAAIAGSIAFTGFSGTYAAPKDENKTQMNQPPKIDVDKVAKEVSELYDVKENEVKTALNDKRPLDDVYYAAMLAKVSGKSFQKVISMKADWFDVERELGVTDEQIRSVVAEMMIKDISVRSELDEGTVRNLLNNHYHPRDIRIAGRIAKASNKSVQSILDMKKINQRWRDVAKELGLSEDIVRPRNPIDEEEDAQAGQSVENVQS